MSSFTAQFVSFLEKRFRFRPLQKSFTLPGKAAISDNTTIAVVGGGLAGPAFARRALSLAAQLGVRINVVLLTQPTCNYCAGLITDLTLQTMDRLYQLQIPGNIIKESIHEVVYLNPHGSVNLSLAAPLTSVFRTNRFHQSGFDDFWLDSVFDGLESESSLIAQRGGNATRIERKSPGSGFLVSGEKDGSRFELDADIVVLATGLKSLQQPLIQKFIVDFGYQPPVLMDGCVTEVNTAQAQHDALSGRALIIDGVIPGCIVAFIPKGREWLTITGLGKVLADHDLELLFNHPIVRHYIRLDRPIDHLRCRKICSAGVVIKPAQHFFGDGWAMVGDLSGHGRALKDGYFVALHTADLAARTILCYGPSAVAFQRHYLQPLRKLEFDNRVGMLLYDLDQKTINGFIGVLLFNGARLEIRRERYGGFLAGALRALFSGELSYKIIAGFFAPAWVCTFYGAGSSARWARNGASTGKNLQEGFPKGDGNFGFGQKDAQATKVFKEFF